jgi:hypothetical protein
LDKPIKKEQPSKQFSQVGSKVNSRPTVSHSNLNEKTPQNCEEIKKNFIKLNMEKAKQVKKIEKIEMKPKNYHLGAIPQ